MEALDLGATLCQSAARSIYTCYLLVAVPIIAIALATYEIAGWLPLLLLWWLKPWLDRTILFVVSRAAFGQATDLATLWFAQRQVWWSQLLLTLTAQRLSPWRSLTQPIYQLEGVSFGRQMSRVRQIRARGTGTALLMTSAFSTVEQILAAGLLIFIAALVPGVDSGVDAWFGAGVAANPLTSLPFAACYALTIGFLEPFYVSAGFALYLNRRVELEAWDIEQEFRRAFKR